MISGLEKLDSIRDANDRVEVDLKYSIYLNVRQRLDIFIFF